jgi:4-methyl-5(b-hydroxyethyl)-thiazole monophosphate biosynthesis
VNIKAKETNDMAKTVLVPIADGTEEIEAVNIIDTLRRAGLEVTVASVMGKLQIKASRGVHLVADTLITKCTDNMYDAIVLPGGIPGAEHLRDSLELVLMLKQQKDAGRIYAAICASPAVVFESHGLLEGKQATAHPAFSDKLNNQEAVNNRVVVDGTCVTSRGPGTAIEFALKLIEVMLDKEQADNIAGPMLVLQE